MHDGFAVGVDHVDMNWWMLIALDADDPTALLMQLAHGKTW
jgi:hypothetical protein